MYDIEKIITAIRLRMRAGISKKYIARELGQWIPQEQLFLCYHAAKILEDDRNKH